MVLNCLRIVGSSTEAQIRHDFRILFVADLG